MRGFALVLCLTCWVACGDDGDTEAPDTTIDSPPPALSNQNTVSIAFSAVGNANKFVCTLDGNLVGACTSPFTSTLTDGPHTFEVAAALNSAIDETPATAMFAIDTVAPTTTITSSPPSLDANPTPSFEFTGSDEAGAVTFECSLDGSAFAPCTSPKMVDTPDGAHNFAVRARDAAGNLDTSPAIVAWTVDTSTPDTSIVTGPDDASTSGPAGAFTFTSPAGSVTFECSFDGAAFAACTSPVPFTLGDGAHTFAVRAVSIGGPDPTPAGRAWTVDAIAPDVAFTSTPVDPSNQTTPAFAFGSSDATAAFDCRVDAGAFAACTSPFTTATLADGSHTVAVRARDAVGNQTTASFTWVVDTVAPTVTIVTAPPAFTNDDTPSVAFSTAGAAVLVECGVDGGAFAACTSPFTSASLADGPHTIAVRATDAAGNAGTGTATFTVDTVAPVVAITSEPGLTNNNKPTLAFTVSGANVVQCRVDAGAFTACVSPITLGLLADGPHTFELRASDTAGNAASTSALFTVDTVAPTVSITSAPPATSNNTTPSVAFTTAGAPTAITCIVDGGAPVACTSPFTSSALADGTHTITVRVADGAGNASQASVSFGIDTVAPTVTITDQPPAISNDNTPAVAFVVAGGPTSVTCQVDTGAQVACASPFAPGTIADGPHTITVRVADGAGNSSSAVASFTIDATRPTIQIITQPPVLTNDNTPTVTFDVGGSPTLVECRVDAGAFAACTSPFTTATLPDGNHSITIRATDAAANTDTKSAAFTIDATPPTVAITGQPLAISSDNTPTVTFTTGGGPTSIQCQIDGGVFATCTSPFTPTVPDGDHTITVKVTDAATNTASATTSTFTVDTVPPSVTITAQPVALSNDNTPTVTFTTGGSPTTIECKVDAGAFAACTSPFTPTVADGSHTIAVRVTDAAANQATATTNTFTVDTVPPTVTITSSPLALSNNKTPSVAFTTAGSPTVTQCKVDSGSFVSCTSPFSQTVADGTHTITVRVADGAGNSNTASTASFVVDTVPPTVSITSQPAALSNDKTPTVSFTTGGAPTSIQCQLDAGAFAACTSPFTTTVADGDHTITVKVTDGAGNSASASTATFTVDTDPPTLTITSQPAALSNDNTPTVVFTTAGGSTTKCAVDGGAFADCTSPFTAGPLADGTHTISVRIGDSAGNSTNASTNPFVIDTIAPTVTITSEPAALSNDNTPTVVFTTAGLPTSIQCQVDGGAFAACTSPFTTTVADGTHTITVKVSDGALNSSTATTNLFTVDTDPPVVTITNATPPANDNTPTFTFTVTGASTVTCAIDGGTPAACTSPFTSSALADGSHSIVVAAADSAGNTDSDTQAFSIDTVPPTVAITGGPVGPTGDATPAISFTTSADAATVECDVDGGGFTACTSPFTPATLAAGPHTVTVRAKDAATNAATASRSFEVDPTVFCLAAGDQPDGDIVSSVEGLTTATVEVWFRSQSATGDFTLWEVTRPTLTPDIPRVALFHTGTELVVEVATPPGTANQRHFDVSGVTITDWHHYAVVFTGSTQRLFVDGVELTGVQGTGSAATGFATAFPSLDLTNHPSLSIGNAADGAFLDLRFSNTARFTGTFTPVYPATADAASILLFPLDEGTGDTSTDDVNAKTLLWPTDQNWNACFGP